jgi:hypothetical protein
MNTNYNEDRKFKRYTVDSIHGNLLYSSDVNIVNISIDGAAIETSKRLNIDREYTLKIKYGNKFLSIKGIVVWSNLSRTTTNKDGEVVPVYKAGVRFTNVLTEKSYELMKFIEENKSDSIEQRLVGVRFKMKKMEDAFIDHADECRIKRISLSGMLIEADDFIDVDFISEMEIFLDNKLISITGRVANCTEMPGDKIKKYNIGVEFIKMSDENKNTLKKFLDSLDV